MAPCHGIDNNLQIIAEARMRRIKTFLIVCCLSVNKPQEVSKHSFEMKRQHLTQNVFFDMIGNSLI